MADIIRLRGSPHEQTQLLLPWRTNGTLDAEEKALVDAHLAECAECRADAKADAALRRSVAGASLDVEHGLANIGGKLEPSESDKAKVFPFLRRRIPVGWLIGGQAAAAVLLLAVYVSPPAEPVGQTYHTLGSPSVNLAGNAVVIFQPDATEAMMRNVLLEADARVIDGPNASGAYVLQVPIRRRDSSLESLRAAPEVLLAEPIDGGVEP